MDALTQGHELVVDHGGDLDSLDVFVSRAAVVRQVFISYAAQVLGTVHEPHRILEGCNDVGRVESNLVREEASNNLLVAVEQTSIQVHLFFMDHVDGACGLSDAVESDTLEYGNNLLTRHPVMVLQNKVVTHAYLARLLAQQRTFFGQQPLKQLTVLPQHVSVDLKVTTVR